MNKINLKNFYLNLAIILIVFIFDRITKLYILKLAEVEASVDIYITSYLNLFLIWNKGIAFGLFSIDGSVIYNSITILIGLIIIAILFMMLKNNNIQRYFLALIAGGALGNFYDRIVIQPFQILLIYIFMAFIGLFLMYLIYLLLLEFFALF